MKHVSCWKRRAGDSVELRPRKKMLLGPVNSPHRTVLARQSLGWRMKLAGQGILPSEMVCVCVRAKVLCMFGGFVVIVGDLGLTQLLRFLNGFSTSKNIFWN